MSVPGQDPQLDLAAVAHMGMSTLGISLVDSLPEDEGEGCREYRKMTPRFKALGEDGDRLLVAWNMFTQMSHRRMAFNS